MDQWAFSCWHVAQHKNLQAVFDATFEYCKMQEADDGYAAESPWVTKMLGACLTLKT